jgi:hypothetical protein
MPRIILDFDPPQPEAPDFTYETDDLVYFLSWAFSARYGAQHEMSITAEVLRKQLGLDLQPLLTFADRDTDDPADEDALDRAWQAAAPLARSCADVVEALSSGDPRLPDLETDYPDLQANIRELGHIAQWAAERSARIRITYALE